MNAKDTYLTFIVGQRTEEEAQKLLESLKHPEQYQILCLVDTLMVSIEEPANRIGYTVVRRGTV